MAAVFMALGGQSYVYSEQDWSGLRQEDLGDAIVETTERARHHITEGLAFVEGLAKLAQHATPELLFKLKAGSPFLASALAGGTIVAPVV